MTSRLKVLFTFVRVVVKLLKRIFYNGRLSMYRVIVV